MKCILLFLFFEFTAVICNGEVFKFDFEGTDLLNPANRLTIAEPKLPPDKPFYLLEPEEFREPKYNFIKEIRENAERIIGGVVIFGFALRLYERFRKESPVSFSRYENGVKAKAEWKFGPGNEK